MMMKKETISSASHHAAQRRRYSSSSSSSSLPSVVLVMMMVMLWGIQMQTTSTHNVVAAFIVSSPTTATATTRNRNSRDSALHATVPIFIIGPMIKKMRENNAKKNVPLVNKDETYQEASGLKIGANVWKWPPIWPYDNKLFISKYDEDLAANSGSGGILDGLTNNQKAINEMASMLSGVAQAPTSTTSSSTEEEEEEEDSDEENKFDPLVYWGKEQKENVATEITDPDVIEKLQEHYRFYLEDGMSVLEFGAASNSYLPDNLSVKRHVGIGACLEQMESNPSLTQRLQIDLNDVVEGRDIDNDELRALTTDEGQFDAILMSNTVMYLTSPREVFRTAWYLLKPGGIMIVSFCDDSSKNFEEAETRMWRDYNNDQHIWMTGSFFQFSAGDGWEQLLGFEKKSSDDNAAADNNPITGLVDRVSGKTNNNNLYVVQAVKGFQDTTIDPNNLERSINSLCWMLPVLEGRDKTLLIPRLARIYETCDSEQVRNAIERNISNLPKIYSALVKMDAFAFTFDMQAQLSADLISDVDFTASDKQIKNLKQGLGLRTPSPEFWVPIGQYTANMDIEERISLLAYIVPRFDSGNPKQDDALQAFVTGLEPTYKLIRRQCPTLSEADIELLGTELLASEILTLGRCSTRTEFANWLSSLTSDDLIQILNDRKSIRMNAKQELENYKKQKLDEKMEFEEYKKKYEEQIQVARQERSLVFNAKTQKMQVFDNPLKKKK